MQSAILALWPTAPVFEVSRTERWARFEGPMGSTVYLQRYAWDETSLPHFLVVQSTTESADKSHSDQQWFANLDEAVHAVRGVFATAA